MPRRAFVICLVLAAVSSAGCDVEERGEAATTPTSLATTTSTTTTSPTTSSTTTTSPTTTTTIAPTTTQAATTTTAPGAVEIGRSVDGRPIEAVRRGTPGGAVVLVIGAIHGDEQAGLMVVEELMEADIPDGIDLWLIETINPDGVAANQRGNANGVDLNRNFPYHWGPIGGPGDGQYAGSSPASEPETQAAVAFIERIQPDLTLWYHQDLFRISPGRGRDGEVRARYAELTGLPVLAITGGIYTGVAATWERNTIAGSIAFVVELGATLSEAEAADHAAAVVAVASDRTLFPST